MLLTFTGWCLLAPLSSFGACELRHAQKLEPNITAEHAPAPITITNAAHFPIYWLLERRTADRCEVHTEIVIVMDTLIKGTLVQNSSAL